MCPQAVDLPHVYMVPLLSRAAVWEPVMWEPAELKEAVIESGNVWN